MNEQSKQIKWEYVWSQPLNDTDVFTVTWGDRKQKLQKPSF